MRKTADAELKPQIVALLNACPKCGGELKASILVGFGVCRPQKQVCILRCGFEKDLRKAQHG